MRHTLSESILNEMNKTIIIQDKTIKEQQTKLLDKGKQIEELTNKLSTFQTIIKENKELVSELTTKNNLITELQSLMNISTLKFETYITNTNEMNSVIEKKQSRITLLKQKLKETEDKYNELLQQISSLQTNIEYTEQNYLSQINTLKNEITALKESNANLLKSNKQLNEDNIKHITQLNSINTHNESLQQELKHLNNLIINKDKANTKLQTELTIALSQNKDKEIELNKEKQITSDLKYKADNLNKMCTNYEKAYLQSAQEHQLKMNEVCHLKRKILQSKVENKKVVQGLQNKVNNLSKENIDLHSRDNLIKECIEEIKTCTTMLNDNNERKEQVNCEQRHLKELEHKKEQQCKKKINLNGHFTNRLSDDNIKYNECIMSDLKRMLKNVETQKKKYIRSNK